LSDKGLPIGVDFMRKKYGIPEPAEDEETLSKPSMIGKNGSPGGSDQTGSGPNDQTSEPAAGEPKDQTQKEKLQAVLSIEDDAIFTNQLQKLADEVNQ
jgi:hypothetical protein